MLSLQCNIGYLLPFENDEKDAEYQAKYKACKNKTFNPGNGVFCLYENDRNYWWRLFRNDNSNPFASKNNSIEVILFDPKSKGQGIAYSLNQTPYY